MTAATVHLRFFAAARAAVGTDEQRIVLDRGTTIDDALARAGVPASDTPARRVLERCSFLVNGIATADRGSHLADGDLVDVMPPFAGG